MQAQHRRPASYAASVLSLCLRLCRCYGEAKRGPSDVFVVFIIRIGLLASVMTVIGYSKKHSVRRL